MHMKSFLEHILGFGWLSYFIRSQNYSALVFAGEDGTTLAVGEADPTLAPHSDS